MSLHTRFAEDERIDPAQLIDFIVEVENITVQAGLCEMQFNGFYKLYCHWRRDVIEVHTVEAKVWRGSRPLWLIVDPRIELGAQVLLEHFATPAAQQFLRDTYEDCEEQARWEEQ